MAEPIFIRGINPVWSYVDLVGKQFDDTFFMYVLNNEIPYNPLPVYHDENGNVPWTNPIQFFANGTLPVDIFWDPEKVYRLEFRQNVVPPPSQNDPLIYLVQNYVPGTGGGTPIGSIGEFTENQITNPQFAQISFSSPLNLGSVTSPADINIAPGWFLRLTGTGTATITQLPLTSTQVTPTNAPYALEINTSGFSPGSVILYQRFQQNGVLWAGTNVSTSITARINDLPQNISAQLVDSSGATIAQLLPPTAINGNYNEFKGFATLAASANTNTPPAAYVDYQILLPSSGDVSLTSIQVVQSELPTVFPYSEDTVNRQIDHTFNYYYNSIIMQPKDSILTAWNFSLNPFQFNATALTATTAKCQYIADQTIISTKGALGCVKTGIGSNANRDCLEIQAVSATNQFALIQYLDPTTVMPYWSYVLSSLARARIVTSNGTNVGIKMRLIWSTSLPATLSGTEPIASWVSGEPVFSVNWTAIAPLNDPVYTLPNAYDTTLGGNAFPSFSFNHFQLPAMSTSTMTLGVVIYTTADINPTGTADVVLFDRISSIPNEFALDTNPQTFDQVLRECQYFYEKSFPNNFVPGPTTPTYLGAIITQMQGVKDAANDKVYARSFSLEYKTEKRSSNPALFLFSPATGNGGFVRSAIIINSVFFDGLEINVNSAGGGIWLVSQNSSKGCEFTTFLGAFNMVGPHGTSAELYPEGLIRYQYASDARLGIVP
jgi:hypothetical protein